MGELNRLAKQLLDEEPLLQNAAVRGELSNYKLYPSGHHYFTLKDDTAAIRGVLFRGNASRLRFRPENGLRVIATGRVTLYEKDGSYQIVCTSLSPDGLGDLTLAFEQLKRRLAAEGLFDPDHKKPLPAYPRRIALVTSAAGAAVHDMLRILKARWPLAKVLLLPVRVQGEEAPAEIAGALRYCNRHALAELIITGRGGGSIEDLWAFNDERVARAIYESDIPVISAVGHEPDVTIADFVADLRAATPSNAAELAVPDGAALLTQLENGKKRVISALSQRLRREEAAIRQYQERRVLSRPEAYLEDKRLELAHLHEQLYERMTALLRAREKTLATLAASADAMSPLKVLSRGYAVAEREDGGIVRAAGDVQAGDRLRLTLAEGALACTVDGIISETGRTL